MIASFFMLSSQLKERERHLVKIKYSRYKQLKKKLFIIDRRKNKSKKRKAMVYPIIKINNIEYVVYSVIKQLRIEDSKNLIIENNKMFYR